MSLFTPDTSMFDNYYDKGKYLMGWRMALAFSIVGLLLFTLSLFSHDDIMSSILLFSVILISVACLFYLKITNNYVPLFWIYSISGTVIIHLALNLIMTLPHYVDMIWIIAITFMVFVGLGRKIGVAAVVINAVGLCYFFIFSLNQHIETITPRTNIEIISDITEVFFAFFVLAYLLRQYMIFSSYSGKELKNANQLLSEKNKENIVLIQEIHHRVKNNLQIITSLLRLQKNDLTEESKVKFDEAINRIMAMSIIHKKLYQTEDLSKIDIESYIEDLILEIISSLSTSNDVKTNINTNIQSIGLKTIVPFGLLMNELISNSFKHAFTSNSNRVININIKANNDLNLILDYSDNGTWKEPTESSSQFGLELIKVLTDQLEGDFSRKESVYSFNLQNLDN